MPSSENYVRDYKQEYKQNHSSKKAKEKRASNNKARRIMEKDGKVRKGDGKDVAHKDNNAKNNSKSNLTVQSKAKNRSFGRDSKARRK